MKVELCIPHQGNTTETVYITKWLKSEGEAVKKGEAVLETESEKAVLNIESPVDGILVEILAGDDEEVPVGEVVAFIETA